MKMKLNKDQIATFDDLLARGQSAAKSLSDAADKYNAAIDEAWQEFAKVVDEVNEVQDELRGFTEETAADLRCQFDDKSEKWQEGEKGQSADGMVNEWEGITFDHIEFDEPDQINLEDVIIYEDFEPLPTDSE
jgi:chromosome segregation ATPase